MANFRMTHLVGTTLALRNFWPDEHYDPVTRPAASPSGSIPYLLYSDPVLRRSEKATSHGEKVVSA